MALTATQIDARYGSTHVLQDVSCRVLPGRVTALVGPNGAGKSTLVRVLMGSFRPSAGSVELDGVAVRKLTVRERANRLAFIPQVGREGRSFSSLQVVRLGRLAFREPSAASTELARAALQSVGLAHKADWPLGTLSEGQQQRVLLARAIVQLGIVGSAERSRGSAAAGNQAVPKGQPDAQPAGYLLADEPIASMDPRHALLCMKILVGAARAGAGVLVVLHDFAMACRFADDALLLDDGGGLAASGTAADVLTPENLSRVFGARFEMMGGVAGGERFPVAVDPAAQPSEWVEVSGTR